MVVGRKEPLRLFFFGDSICFGQGVSHHKTWVSKISRALSDTYGAEGVIVQNPSVNGNTTRMALERMPHDVQSHRPDILFVQFGLNDCNVWESDAGNPRVSKLAFEANLKEIVARARSFGAKQIILGTNHPTTRTRTIMPGSTSNFETSNRRYNEVIRKVAQDCCVLLADTESLILKNVATAKVNIEETLLPDELHLSELGHDLYFKSRLPLIQEIIEQITLLTITD